MFTPTSEFRGHRVVEEGLFVGVVSALSDSMMVVDEAPAHPRWPISGHYTLTLDGEPTVALPTGLKAGDHVRVRALSLGSGSQGNAFGYALVATEIERLPSE